MSLETLASKYIISTEKVLKELQQTKNTIKVTEEDVDIILHYVKDYMKDAKYYLSQKRFETSLISIIYCEGLLDALKLLGAVKFEWPTRVQRKK